MTAEEAVDPIEIVRDVHRRLRAVGNAERREIAKRYFPSAMTVFGASPSVIFDIIHSENDTFRHFSLPHYRNAFLLAGALLRELDGRPGRSPAAAASTAR